MCWGGKYLWFSLVTQQLIDVWGEVQQYNNKFSQWELLSSLFLWVKVCSVDLCGGKLCAIEVKIDVLLDIKIILELKTWGILYCLIILILWLINLHLILDLVSMTISHEQLGCFSTHSKIRYLWADWHTNLPLACLLACLRAYVGVSFEWQWSGENVDEGCV